MSVDDELSDLIGLVYETVLESHLARDEWWLAFSKRFDEGVLTGADCVEPRQLHRAPLYNEVLVRAGIEDGIFAGIDRASGADSIAAFYRGPTRAAFGHAEVEVLSLLLPHLRRAVRISDRFALVRSERDATEPPRTPSRSA